MLNVLIQQLPNLYSIGYFSIIVQNTTLGNAG